MGNTICEVSCGDFFTQSLFVGNILEHSWDYCEKLCINKKVLHVGCSDYPLFSKEGSLHLKLIDSSSELHGCDIEGLTQLKECYGGIYFNSIEEVIMSGNEYDTILVPNVIEHIKNPGIFIENLFRIKFKTLFILVPNFSVSHLSSYNGMIFTERVHPDHYCWYSPYTLWNLFSKYLDGFNCEINFFTEDKSMVSLLINAPC